MPVRYLFFRKDLSELQELDNDISAQVQVNEKYSLIRFKPDWTHITPKGMKNSFGFIMWWLLSLVIWRQQGKNYEHYIVYAGERLIHYCIVLPKYYRYPFMGDNDIQIGPFWTAEEYRGQGICPFVIHEIVKRYKSRKKYAHIITRENNVESQRSIMKAGFDIYGYGVRTKGLFGIFLIKTGV